MNTARVCQIIAQRHTVTRPSCPDPATAMFVWLPVHATAFTSTAAQNLK